MTRKPYSEYTLEDFIWDQSFRKWVKNPENKSAYYWQNWLHAHPEKAALAQEAREIILSLSVDADEPFEEELAHLWSRISQTNAAADFDEVINLPAPAPAFHFRWQWAASLIGILLISTVLWYAFQYAREARYATSYGEVKTLILPDQSEVKLNANSKIHYKKYWNEAEVREVWLEGEAYFTVVHTQMHQKFLVYTSNLAVEVLGTKFNVNARHGKTKVVLSEGKVSLHLPVKNKSLVEMKPGELVEVHRPTETPAKKQVKAENYTAWKENKLVFEEATLREIATVLEDNYGFTIRFENPAIATYTFTGSVNRENVEILLTILEKSFQIQITRTGNELIIR